MFTRIKSIVLSTAIALGAFAAVPATAQADNFYFGIGGGARGSGVEIQFGGRGPQYDRHHGPRRGCSAREAVRKAERMGIRRAHVRGESRQVIHVAGRDRGRPVVVTFGKAPHCPVLR